MKRGTLSLAAVGIVSSMVLAACGGDGGDGGGSQEPTGGTFVVYLGEPESLTPTNTNESEGSQVLSALFSGLVDYDPETSEPENDVAESIESDDNKVWTIKIEEGWKFHDGTPVTAESFVDAWNYGALSTNAQGNSYFYDKIQGYDDLQGDAEKNVKPKAEKMSGLKVIDERTFEVTLKDPFSQFPLMLGYTAFYPMPKVAFQDIKAFNEAPVGNGPFMMDGKWVHDQEIKIKRFEDYSGEEKANADSVVFQIYKEVDTAYNDLKAGNVDVMDTIPPTKIAEAERELGDRFIQRESSVFQYLGIPLYDKRFQNKKLRQALSLAINREEITEKIFRGTRVPARSMVSPVVLGSREDACEYCTHDPERAKKLLEEAGGWQGTMTIWFNSGAGHEDWVEAVSNQWRNTLGITDIKFESLDFAQYLPKLDARAVTGPFRLGWAMDYPSPQNYLEPIHGSNGSSNNSGYNNPEFDKLIAEGNRAENLEAGIEKYQAAEDLLLEDLPILPIMFSRVTGAHSEKVSNVIIDAFNRIRLAQVRVNS